MIKANELRIGNWVISHSNNHQHQISALDINDIDLKYKTRHSIPLTPEILEKCGFIKNELERGNQKEGYYYGLDLSSEKYCDLGLIEGDKNGMCEVFLFPYDNFFRFKYLHQLQNIYFALTGTELNYQP